MFGFWADRPFRFVRFDVPAEWGMPSPRGDRKLTILARTLVHEMEGTSRPERRMRAFERFLAGWRRMAGSRRYARAGEPDVRERVFHFVRNRLARLFALDRALLGRLLEENGV